MSYSHFYVLQVGIGNVWRFPYLAFQNGGAAFLIPYFILLILVGKPMYYMETAMGQFSRTSPLQLWECAPIAKGNNRTIRGQPNTREPLLPEHPLRTRTPFH